MTHSWLYHEIRMILKAMRKSYYHLTALILCMCVSCFPKKNTDACFKNINQTCGISYFLSSSSSDLDALSEVNQMTYFRFKSLHESFFSSNGPGSHRKYHLGSISYCWHAVWLLFERRTAGLLCVWYVNTISVLTWYTWVVACGSMIFVWFGR